MVDAASETSPLADLPRDVQERLLRRLDFRSLGRLACASRSMQGAARTVQAAPLWRTAHTAELCVEEDDLPAFVGGLLDGMRFCARPDLCLVFASAQWSTYSLHEDALHVYLRARLPACCSIVVCYTSMVIGRDGSSSPVEHVDGSAALSLSLVHLPASAHLLVNHYQRGTGHRTGFGLTDMPPGCHPVLLLDGAGLQHRWQQTLQLHAPTATAAGGVLDLHSMSASLAEAHAAPGYRRQPLSVCAARSVMLVFHGPSVDVCSLSVRGVRPEEGLCRPLGAAQLQSERDLREALQGARQRMQGEGALGCLMCASSLSAGRLHALAGVHSAEIEAAFPGIALAGFLSAGGEFGPPPHGEQADSSGRSRPLTCATVLAFVRLLPPPA